MSTTNDVRVYVNSFCCIAFNNWTKTQKQTLLTNATYRIYGSLLFSAWFKFNVFVRNEMCRLKLARCENWRRPKKKHKKRQKHQQFDSNSFALACKIVTERTINKTFRRRIELREMLCVYRHKSSYQTVCTCFSTISSTLFFVYSFGFRLLLFLQRPNYLFYGIRSTHLLVVWLLSMFVCSLYCEVCVSLLCERLCSKRHYLCTI